jgi:hypothetical protein
MRWQSLGYNPDGLSREERIQSLPEPLHDHAEETYSANGGIGWPLQAIFVFVVTAPYACAVFVIHSLWLVIQRRFSHRRVHQTHAKHEET